MSQFWKGKVACETTTFGGVCPDMPSHAQTCLDFRPILKSCSFPIHRPGEIKNSHEPPAGGKCFLQSLCLKRYTIKRFKKISS